MSCAHIFSEPSNGVTPTWTPPRAGCFSFSHAICSDKLPLPSLVQKSSLLPVSQPPAFCLPRAWSHRLLSPLPRDLWSSVRLSLSLPLCPWASRGGQPLEGSQESLTHRQWVWVAELIVMAASQSHAPLFGNFEIEVWLASLQTLKTGVCGWHVWPSLNGWRRSLCDAPGKPGHTAGVPHLPLSSCRWGLFG